MPVNASPQVKPVEVRRIRILFLEDNADDADLIVAQLKSAGFSVEWQRVDSEEEFAAQLAWAPDVVMADYRLPGYTALEALRVMREQASEIPTIVVSGSIGDELAAECIKAGAVDYLLKDRLGRLPRAIEMAIQQRLMAAKQRSDAERLERERALLRALIDQTTDPIYVKDRDSRFVLANSALARLAGVKSADELVGRSDSDFLPLPLAVQFRAEDRLVIDGRPVINREQTVPGADGTERTLLTTKLPLRQPDGTITGLIGIGRDITDRKRAELALRESEAQLEAVVENLTEGLVVATLEGDLLHWNRSALEMLGLSTPEEGRKKLAELEQMFALHDLEGTPLSIDKWPLPRICRGETLRGFEARVRRKDSDWERIFSFGGALVRDAGGRQLAFVTITDVTERRRAERRIEEQARLLDLASDAICVRDMQDRILYWNHGAELIYGWSSAEVIGRPASAIVGMKPEQWEVAVAATIEHGAWNGEVQQARRDGRVLTIHCRWTLLRDAQGAPASILAINSDISEKKLLEAQFFRVQRLEAIGSLASGIAHDLNNILAPILMAAPLLRMPLPAADVSKTVSNIETSARRGADLVRQLLMFGRGLEGEKGPVRLRQLVREIAGIASETFPKNIALQIEISRDVWLVNGDSTQLHQLLLNLAVNARDAMPQGGTLTFSAANVTLAPRTGLRHAAARPGPHVKLSVIDTGTGIPPEIMDKIFDPFFSTKEPGKGTGLGLSTALGVVKGHGGFMDVRSQVGHGTVFEIYLPAVTAGGATTDAAEGEAVPRGSGQLVLVVDDEAPIRSVLRETLEHFGYRAILAEDGAQAVALVTQHIDEVSLVVADVDMPFIDGITLTKVIRKLKPSAAVILLSGLVHAQGLESRQGEIDEVGVHSTLAKPCSSEKLLRAVHEALNSRRK